MCLAQQRQSPILGALEQLNLFGPSNKVLYLKKLVIKSGVRFFILFVLVDAILQKVVYFKSKIGNRCGFFGFMHVSYGNNRYFITLLFVHFCNGFSGIFPIVQNTFAASNYTQTC